MKSRDGKSQRREEKKKEAQKRESLRRKKIQVREKVGKSQNTVFFQWFVAPEGRKCGLAKAVGAEQSGQIKDEQLHAVVARSTFGSQNPIDFLFLKLPPPPCAVLVFNQEVSPNIGIHLWTILFSDSTLQRWFRRRPSCGTDGSPSKFCGPGISCKVIRTLGMCSPSKLGKTSMKRELETKTFRPRLDLRRWL